MTKLQCNVVHCEYNSDNHCCRPDIKVGGGHEAKTSNETSCDSFKARTNGITNRVSTYSQPDKQLQVSCSASSCQYNAEGRCAANAIHIGGTAARKRQQTVCDTFSCHSCKH